MPRYRPETARAKAKQLTKIYLQNHQDGARTAKVMGTTRQNVCQRLQKAPVQKTLQDIIDRNLKRAGITQIKVYKRLDQELDATRVISAVISPDGRDRDANGQTCDFIDVPDWNARDKAIDKSLTLMGHIKQTNGNGKGTSILQIFYGYRGNTNTPGPIRPAERAGQSAEPNAKSGIRLG